MFICILPYSLVISGIAFCDVLDLFRFFMYYCASCTNKDDGDGSKFTYFGANLLKHVLRFGLLLQVLITHWWLLAS